ncbi:Sec-independent protein translocase subunit TatA [Demequina lignilytica]|uniref:Sec-independent protein translocase protein TatA n=1 Tax=Demequina lignilytica TaxID=3051663 RepID=A0AAW7M176_9MICO|nr:MULTISPECIES: Sec-independent protein translocase subunit TatA [unclassified Demequina]MDN4482013.1 Sec-independent protein translocase subunit TatA [Demequina sp. SYSU T0a273]MDN4486672.1 Sec-independent protein translocase subunit TatA [Demequina sp. SYSU T00039]MDN4489358.1 Sec-independent protein translocase subunit TatA [Demequina sp. SYSU T00068]
MGPREIIIILVIVLLLFGAPKLPQLARSLGQSMRILKEETKTLTDDKSSGDAATEEKPASSSDEPREQK